MAELERRRLQACEYLCYVKAVKVSRERIVVSVLDAYREDLELEHHRINVEMEGEQGVDMDGMTKEMFPVFFAAFAEKYMVGTIKKFPTMTTGKYTGIDSILSMSIKAVLCKRFFKELNFFLQKFVFSCIAKVLGNDTKTNSYENCIISIKSHCRVRGSYD